MCADLRAEMKIWVQSCPAGCAGVDPKKRIWRIAGSPESVMIFVCARRMSENIYPNSPITSMYSVIRVIALYAGVSKEPGYPKMASLHNVG